MNDTQSAATPKPMRLEDGFEFRLSMYSPDDGIEGMTLTPTHTVDIDPVLGAEVTVTLKVVELRRSEKLS